MYRVVFSLRFKRRGKYQTESVNKLLKDIFDGEGADVLNSCIVTTDRGYRKEAIMEVISYLGLSYVYILPENILRSHPFVRASITNLHREDNENTENLWRMKRF